MRLFAVATLIALLASPAFAQNPNPPAGGPGTGQGRFQPTQALSLTADQRTKIAPAYTALNGVMKDAAARRLAIRQQMQASGGFTPGQEPTPAQRAKFDSVRTEMVGFQAEADQWYAAIRNNLTAAQQVKFDALPKPRVMGRMGGGPPRQ